MSEGTGGPRRDPRPHLDPLGAPARRLAQRALAAPAAAVDPDRRFHRAVRRPATEGGAPDDAEVLALLREAPVRGMARIVYSSNATFLLELEADDPRGDGPLRAVYKPARGERPLWDFPHRTLHYREVATYLVDVALGFGLVPATTLRDGPAGPGSVQRFVPGPERAPGRAARAALEERLPAVAALDALVNNADRKSAHLLIGDDGRLQAIDHGLTFLPYPRQRTVLIELGGETLPEGVATAVRSLQDDGTRRGELLARLGRLLDAAEVGAFAGRLRELAEEPHLPRLDAWDGRPFEWW